MLERAGRPVSWSTNLHWAEIQSAILRDDQEAFARHVTALSDDALPSRVAARLAEAGRIWTAALAGEVDVEAVERAVRELAAAGYPWDAGRLAGRAAGGPPSTGTPFSCSHSHVACIPRRPRRAPRGPSPVEEASFD